MEEFLTSNLSPSGARIRGDDYQHLFALTQALRALQPGSGVIEIGIEDPDAGNADDVTVRLSDGQKEYFQVKSSVDAQEVVGVDWLMESKSVGGQSIIRRFYDVWKDESTGQRPEIFLVTNRLPASEDPIIKLRDGRDGTVAQRLRLAKPRSKAGIARKNLAEHLRITEEELLEFLSHLHFVVGRLHGEWKEQASHLMYAVGLRHDDEAIALGISIVREWVTSGKRKLPVGEIRDALEQLRRPSELPTASLLVQAIDRDPMPENALIALDWVDMFPGDEARTRRRPQDDRWWNSKFRPELQGVARKLRAIGCTRVLVRGYMRLPTWFAVGVELGKTAGYEVASFQGVVPWASEGDTVEFPIETIVEELGEGTDVAIGIALAYDPSEDVIAYLRSVDHGVGRYICIRPKREVSNHAIRSPAEARGWAYNVRDEIRRISREQQPAQLHVFLAGPHGAALLLGHLWDRMPPTQLYEDLGTSGGYLPSYVVPN